MYVYIICSIKATYVTLLYYRHISTSANRDLIIIIMHVHEFTIEFKLVDGVVFLVFCYYMIH